MDSDQAQGREWIKVGDDPLRYEYGRGSENPAGPAIKDQLAYVEEEKYSSYFQWETYKSHKGGAEPSVEEAQEAAVETLKENGWL